MTSQLPPEFEKHFGGKYAEKRTLILTMGQKKPTLVIDEMEKTMSTELELKSRVLVTPQGEQIVATATPDKTIVLTVVENPNKRKGFKVGPFTISGLDPDEIDRILNPGNSPDNDPVVMYWFGPLLGAFEAYFEYRTAKEKNRGCRETTQSGTQEIEVDGVKIKTTVTTTVGCPD